MAALILEVVELMAKLTYRIGPITGLVEKIWGLANPKSRGASRNVLRCRGY